MAIKQAHWYCLRSPADEDEPKYTEIQKYEMPFHQFQHYHA
jgi:hypothetical protein